MEKTNANVSDTYFDGIKLTFKNSFNFDLQNSNFIWYKVIVFSFYPQLVRGEYKIFSIVVYLHNFRK